MASSKDKKDKKPPGVVTLKKQLKKAREKIKSLEAGEQKFKEFMKRAPNVRDSVYFATYWGLVYACYHGYDILERFMFQWGGSAARVKVEKPSDVQDILVRMGTGAAGTTGWADDLHVVLYNIDVTQVADILWGVVTKQKNTQLTRKQMNERDIEILKDGIARGLYEGDVLEHKQKLLADLEGRNFDIKKDEFIAEVKKVAFWVRLFTAMGTAGCIMLFLQETSVSEVASIAVDALDAVTPLT